MGFDDGLRSYLESVRRGTAPAVPGEFEPSRARAHLIVVGETLDAKPIERPPNSFSISALERQRSGQRIWQKEDRGVAFANRLVPLLRASLWQDSAPAVVDQLVLTALSRKFGLDVSLESASKTRELDRLIAEAAGSVDSTAGQKLPDYSQETRLVTASSRSAAVTPLGEVLLDLRGRDAIRWLLHVEAAQSTGAHDAWRVSPAVARFLLANRNYEADSETNDPFAWATTKRLEDLHCLQINRDEYRDVYRLMLTDLGVELLTPIAEGKETPMSIMATNLLADLTNSAMRPAAGAFESVLRHEQEQAYTRSLRMISHEFRNVLVPARMAFDLLRRHASGTLEASQVQIIDSGLTRALGFLDELSRTALLAVGAAEPVDVVAAIRDAVAATVGGGGLQVHLSLPETLPLVTARRPQMVLAFVSLLRNAAQASLHPPAQVKVSGEVRSDGNFLVLYVDDDGPGVPTEQREAIFTEGVSLRPGGSGLGLSLVKELVTDCGGRVDCSAGPLGGARFTIHLPVNGPRSGA